MGDTAIQRVSDSALWTETDVALVRAQHAKGTTDAEWRQFVYLANKYQLDPMIRQIWCIKYGQQEAQIFAGRDGFLAIAHRSGAFDGMNSTVRVEQVPFTVEYKYWADGQRRTGTYSRDYQFVATTTVYHKAMAHPIMVEVWEGEYSTGQNLWLSKPRTMVVKVAESQALRRAFNISGLYDPAEMGNKGEAPDDLTVIEGEAREVVPAQAPNTQHATRNTTQAEAEAAPRMDPVIKAAMKRYADAATEAGHATKAAQRAWAEAHSNGRPLEALSVADWDHLAGAVVSDFMDGPTRTWQPPAMADAETGEAP